MTIKARIKAVTPGWLWDRLHRMRNEQAIRRSRREVERYPARVVRHTYAGVPLAVEIADPTAAQWYDRDWARSAEFKEITLLKAHQLKPGARVFDVGAHQCVVALVLVDAVGPTGSVVAVEAHPHNARVASRNRELNRAENLTVLNAAVADRPGRIVINETLNSRIDDRGSFGRIEVDAMTIDDLTARFGPPDVLFVDIEGFEVHALRGAVQTLKARPDVLVEVHVGCGLEEAGETVPALLAAFPAGAYEFHVAAGFKDGATCDCLDFGPYHPDDPALAHRFFLAAFPREVPA